MFDEHFNPLPSRRNRGILRWLLLALNGIGLALFIFFYPDLLEYNPVMFADNDVRLAVIGWGLFLIAHLIFVSLLEVRENVINARTYRRRQRDFHRRWQQQSQEAKFIANSRLRRG